MLGYSEREAHMRALAGRLEFGVQKSHGRFTLIRTADVTVPVRQDRLTLDRAEGLLEIWKLRGHG
jgi:hypothetical protein